MSLSSHSNEEIDSPPRGWRPHYTPLDVCTTKSIAASKAFVARSATVDLIVADIENQIPVDEDASDVPEVVVVTKDTTGKRKKMTRWPQMTTMMAKDGPYQCKVVRILLSIHKCGCLTESLAKDGNNPKGNAWNKYHDHCFGGGDPGLGLIQEFLLIAKLMQLKSKIMGIWQYVVANKDKVSAEVFHLCETQYDEYLALLQREKVAKETAVSAEAQLKGQMRGYKGKKNGLPPGAIGILGAGWSQHSTNLTLGDPACYAYASSKTPAKKTSINSNSNLGSVTPKLVVQRQKNSMACFNSFDTMMSQVLEAVKPPAPPAPPAPTPRSDSDDISSLNDSARSAKRHHLESRKENLMQQIKFMKELGDDYHGKYNQLLLIFDELEDFDKEE
jgi:hypothetical protein